MTSVALFGRWAHLLLTLARQLFPTMVESTTTPRAHSRDDDCEDVITDDGYDNVLTNNEWSVLDFSSVL
jgi:hypothetical protein